jgi:hypothetical protein
LLGLPVLDSYLSSCDLSVSCLRRFKDRKLAVRKDAKFAEAAPEDILEAMAAQQAAAVRSLHRPALNKNKKKKNISPRFSYHSYHSHALVIIIHRRTTLD